MALTKRRPIGTLQELREFNRDPARHLCCHEPDPPKLIGCPLYEECPCKQKGQSGPVSVAYRIYKPGEEGALVRDMYADCFLMIDATTQYNKNDGYVREIIGYGAGEDPDHPDRVTKILVQGTRPKKGGLPDEWEHFEEEVEVPPFMRLGDRPEMRNQVRARRLLEERKKRREEVAIDTVLRGGRQRDIARAMAASDVQADMDQAEAEGEIQLDET